MEHYGRNTASVVPLRVSCCRAFFCLGHAKSSLPNTLRFLYLLISFPRYTLDLYIYVSRNITRRREFVSIRIFFFFFSLIFLYGIKKILVSIPLIPPIHAVVTLWRVKIVLSKCINESFRSIYIISWFPHCELLLTFFYFLIKIKLIINWIVCNFFFKFFFFKFKAKKCRLPEKKKNKKYSVIKIRNPFRRNFENSISRIAAWKTLPFLNTWNNSPRGRTVTLQRMIDAFLS